MGMIGVKPFGYVNNDTPLHGLWWYVDSDLVASFFNSNFAIVDPRKGTST